MSTEPEIFEAVVDRLEGQYAILEVQGADDLEHVDFPLTALPSGVREGSVLEIQLKQEG